jgi:sodium-dependent dicarboxylate transporter 2/3/5
MANKKGTMTLIHVLVGVAITVLFSQLTPPEPLTQYGLTVVGLFIATNYWFATIGMIWPSILALALYVLTTGASAADSAVAILGTTTVWQTIMLMPICGALKETGATEVIAKFLISRKVLSGKPLLFSYVFLLACFAVGVLTGLSSAVILAFVLFDGVAKAVDCKPGESYYSSMVVATFLAAALGTTVIPYRSYLTAMVDSFSNILGVPMNGALYIVYAFCFMLIFLFLILLTMKVVLRVDMRKLEALDTQALANDVGKINRSGKLLLTILGIVIAGIIYPLVVKSGTLFELLNNTLTNNLFFGLAAVAACMIHVDGKPLMDANKALSKYVPWGLLFSMGIMLFFADCLSADDSGLRAFLSLTMGNLFGNMSSWLFIICVVVLTVIVTGFFSNMATGIVMLTATAPLATQFGVSPMFLGILVMFSSMFGFLTPGGNGLTPLLYGKEEVSSKEIYHYIIPFMLIFMAMNVIAGVVLGTLL